MSRFLVIRLSAIGDVAMLIRLLYAVARANEQHEFIFLTQPFLTELLLDAPDNLEAMAIDIRREERNLLGLLRYARRLREERFDAVLDLHDVLRTKLLRGCLRLAGLPTLHLAKPRKERKAFLKAAAQGLPLPVVPSMPELYLKVFAQAGLSLPQEIPPLSIHPSLWDSFERHYPELATKKAGLKRIALAPFASTLGKTYDLELMQQLLAALVQTGQYELYLLGARGREAEQLEAWAAQYPSVQSLAGRLDFATELLFISTLDLMVSMDSANMHLASLMGVRVISIWCATHPAAGFLGIGQALSDALHPNDPSWRPSSIFGNKQLTAQQESLCRAGLSPEEILAHIQTALP